jgi:hypothetical protein
VNSETAEAQLPSVWQKFKSTGRLWPFLRGSEVIAEGSEMRQYAAHITISAVAIAFVAIHLGWPQLKVDATTLALLALAALPWLGTVFKSIEFPGGGKLEYQDFLRAQRNASDVGLLKGPGAESLEKGLPLFAAIAKEDWNLALAGLRIEIERRLNDIAKARGITTGRKSVGQLLRSLAAAGAVSEKQQSVLNDMLGLLNMAVHGAQVDRLSAEWAIEVGPQLLAALDDVASSSKNVEAH